ncbi:MAG: aminotransferase class I/II-fold pyridoxal phosphate-dependent enzyme [Polyangiaceae bacterium]|nr:aminotransferase class I/II-fold pyridoxal phosphate-dependent enzyme [Polyangiaceae bacterium]
MRRPGLTTLALHADRPLNPTASVSPAIFQTSTFRWPEVEAGAQFAGEHSPSAFYTRMGNPNQHQLEAIVASLEGSEAALSTASGAAACTLAVLPHVKAGDHVVAGKTLYGETNALLTKVLPRFGVETTFVQGSSAADYERAVRPQTRVIIVETPANPTLDVVDIAAVAQLAKANSALLVCDNTFATPVNTRPITLGAHLVFHSATKYLAGHSDVIAGVLCGSRELVGAAWDHLRVVGSSLGPFEAWLVIRGLRTLSLRMARHNENARALSYLLAAHPKVAMVRYPGLGSSPDHEIAARQMSGFGGMIYAELKGGDAAARSFVQNLRYFSLATSLGGVESLVQYPASLSNLTPDQKRAAGISPTAIRISVGCEDTQDLLDDVENALSLVV